MGHSTDETDPPAICRCPRIQREDSRALPGLHAHGCCGHLHIIRRDLWDGGSLWRIFIRSQGRGWMLRARCGMRSSGGEQIIRLRLRDHGPRGTCQLAFCGDWRSQDCGLLPDAYGSRIRGAATWRIGEVPLGTARSSPDEIAGPVALQAERPQRHSRSGRPQLQAGLL